MSLPVLALGAFQSLLCVTSPLSRSRTTMILETMIRKRVNSIPTTPLTMMKMRKLMRAMRTTTATLMVL